MRSLLIKKRKNKKLTQQKIAEMLGVSRSTYGAYELGIIDPPLKIATKIKEILNYNMLGTGGLYPLALAT